MAILTVGHSDHSDDPGHTTGDTLAILRGSRIGLTGADPRAVRALLHQLASDTSSDLPDSPAPMRTGLYDSQSDAEWKAGTLLIDVVLHGRDELRLLRSRLAALESLLSLPEPAPDDLRACLERLRERYAQMSGPAFEQCVAHVLSGLGWTAADLLKPLAALGAGAESRARLARVLMAHPDVLLLNEPFAHLTAQAAGWLRQMLAAWPGAWVAAGADEHLTDLYTDRWMIQGQQALSVAARIA